MKNTILILLLIFGLFACEDNDSYFDASIPQEMFGSRPFREGLLCITPYLKIRIFLLLRQSMKITRERR